MLSVNRYTSKAEMIVLIEVSIREGMSAPSSFSLGVDFCLMGATKDLAATNRRTNPSEVGHRSQIPEPYACSPPSQNPWSSALPVTLSGFTDRECENQIAKMPEIRRVKI